MIDASAHLKLVYRVARDMARKRQHDAEDFYGWGWLGLARAAETFDESRGTTFSTHAMPRIRGAILDGLREQDWAPRSLRRKSRELEAVQDRVHDGRDASVSVRTLAKWERETAALDPMPIGELESLLPAIETPADEALIAAERVTLLTRAMSQLPAREREVILAVYVHGRAQVALARELGVTESYISIVRKRGLQRLRLKLAALGAD